MSPAFPQSLPAEIVVTIAKCLDVDDLFNLALTSRHLAFLIQDDQVCRAVLEVSRLRKSPFAYLKYSRLSTVNCQLHL